MDVTLDLNAAISAIDHTHAEWLEQIISTIDRDALLDHAKNISISPTLRDSDREHLHKLIAKRLGSTIKVLRQDLAREIDGSEGKVDKDDRQLARETLDENLIFSGDGFYRWRDTGVWSPSPDREVRTLIGNTLEKHHSTLSWRGLSSRLYPLQTRHRAADRAARQRRRCRRCEPRMAPSRTLRQSGVTHRDSTRTRSRAAQCVSCTDERTFADCRN